MYARHQTQGLGQLAHPCPAQVVIGEHGNGGGHVGDAFRLPGNEVDLDLHQVFETERAEIETVSRYGR